MKGTQHTRTSALARAAARGNETCNLQPATCNRLKPGISSWRLWRAAGWALLFAGSVVSFPLLAQDTTVPTSTNGIAQADDTMSADGSPTATDVREEDAAGTNTLSDTNQAFEPGPDGRTRRLQWQAQLRSRIKPQTNREPRLNASTNSGPSSLDYSSFRLIAERNIFDPNRFPHSAAPAAQPKTADAFTFVGTMSYEKGIFAFFDGTRSEYKKVLKPDESIAGYKVVSISPDAVKLHSNTNNVDLSVGTQMRRRDDGTWDRSAGTETYAATSGLTTTAASSSSSDAAPAGAMSETLRKMMERRKKEESP